MVRISDERLFFTRWTDDIRSEFRRACQKARVFSYVEFRDNNTCNIDNTINKTTNETISEEAKHSVHT